MNTVVAKVAVELDGSRVSPRHLKKMFPTPSRLNQEGRERELLFTKISGTNNRRNRLRVSTLNVDYGSGETIFEDVVRAKILISKKINPILILTLHLEPEKIARLSNYRRIKSPKVQRSLEAIGLGGLANQSDFVYNLLGSVSAKDVSWPEGVTDGWIHLISSKDGYLYSEVLANVVETIAIERALLVSIRNLPHTGPLALLSPMRGGLRLGLLPTAILPSWSKVARYYMDARDGLGFPAFRAEVLGQAKLWWTFVSGSAGLLGLLAIAIQN